MFLERGPNETIFFARFAAVYRSFEGVADFREELDWLERDAPGVAQLPLPGEDSAPDRKCR